MTTTNHSTEEEARTLRGKALVALFKGTSRSAKAVTRVLDRWTEKLKEHNSR